MASRYGSLFAPLSTSVRAEIVFNQALESGIAFIETGRMYDEGKMEQWIGKAVSHRRGEYVLASKCRRSEAAARLTAQTIQSGCSTCYTDVRQAPGDRRTEGSLSCRA